MSKTLESNIKKGKPSTAEAKQIMAAVDAVEEVLGLEDMPEATIDRWEEGSTPHSTRTGLCALGPPAKVFVDRLSNLCGRLAR